MSITSKWDYELVFILSPHLEKDKQAALLSELKKEVEKRKGKVLEEKNWGEKALAYRIGSKGEGIYFFWIISFPQVPPFTKINLFLEREKEILRYLWVKQRRRNGQSLS